MAKSKKQRGRPRKTEAEKRARIAATEASRRRAGWGCFNWKVTKPMLAYLKRKARESGAATVGEYLRARFGAEILAEARARGLAPTTPERPPLPADAVVEPPGCAGVGP